VGRSCAIALLSLACLGLAGCAADPAPIEAAGGSVIRAMALRLGADAAAPERVDPTGFAPSVAWLPVEVPDHWSLPRRLRSEAGWYRAEVSLPGEPPADWVLSLGGRWDHVSVYWDGVRVATSSWAERLQLAPITAESAVLVPLQAERAGPGAHQLLIHFAPLPEEIASLSWVTVGPRTPVLARESRERFVRHVVPSALMLLGVATGALVIGLARYSEKPGVAWLGASVLLWCVSNLGFPLAERGASWAGWAGSLLGHAFVPCAAIGLRRMRGLAWGSSDALLALGVALGAAARAAVPPVLIPTIDNLWWLANLGIVAWFVPLGIANARSGMLPAPYLLLAGAALIVFAALHDFASLAAGRTLLGTRSLVQLLHPSIVVVAACALVAELARSMRDAHVLNRELEHRVEEKRRELAASWARTTELERDRAIAAERERMMRDMHDGTGGQLVSALALVEGGDFRTGDLAETLRGALADLRLAIDSLDVGEADLLVLLAQARARLEPRLEPHGVRFVWKVEDVPTPAHFGPEQTLHVLRIFQEAVTNVLKHARAKTIAVRTGTSLRGGAAKVWIEIADDGTGFAASGPAPRDGTGRGLRNMRRRAADLGGDLVVASGPDGTSIRLELPLEPLNPS
jgi:signal transduction histidine kinase